MSDGGTDLLRTRGRTFRRTTTRTLDESSLYLDFTASEQLDPRITFSRGSQATLFDSTGTLVYAKHNLFLQSQTFENAAWGTSNSSVSANTSTAPDSTSTADTITASATNTSHFINQGVTLIVGATYVFSVFLKAGTKNYAQLALGTQTGTFADFDLTAGAGAVGTTGGVVSTSITSVGNDWYRCVMVFTNTNANTLIITVANSSTDTRLQAWNAAGTETIIAWGAQLNLAGMEGGVTSSLATYYPTTTAAYYAPRFDYNPSTLAAQGLLIEEQRTNSIRNNTMQGAVAGTPGTLPTNWSAVTAGMAFNVIGTGTENGITYIDIQVVGTTTATSSAVRFEPTNQTVAASGQSWTGSFYVRQVAGATTNITGIRTNLFARTSANASNTDDSQSANFVSSISASSLSVARRTHSITLADATTAFVNVQLLFAHSPGVAIDITLRIGLPQLEQGAFATSVIPTTTTALTRNADVASMTGTNFSSWYNASEGTLYYEGMVQVNNDGIVYTGIGDTFDNTAYFVRTAPNQTWAVRSGASAQAAVDVVFTPTANVPFKMVGTLKVNDFAFCVNGGTVATDVSGAVPASAVRLGIGNAPWTASGGNARQQWIRSIRYYPVRLPNSTLQALTA